MRAASVKTFARVLIGFGTAVVYLRIAIFVALGLGLVYWKSEPLLRRDPAPDALSTITGTLMETPWLGCTSDSGKKWPDFQALLKTAQGTVEMTLPCYDDVDRRALNKTLTIGYVEGTDLVGRSYRVVWEMRTPARVYLTFAQRQHDEKISRWTGAGWVLCGLFCTWCALRPQWLRKFLSP